MRGSRTSLQKIDDRNDSIDIDFTKLEDDRFFVNRTMKDFLIVYLNGQMTLGRSQIKFHDNYVKYDEDKGVITLDIDGSIIPNNVKRQAQLMNVKCKQELNEIAYGNAHIFERYYYGADQEHIGEFYEIPTIGNPVVIKSKMSFVLVLFDDDHSIECAINDIKEAGGPHKYAERYLVDPFSNLGVGVRYFNFSPYDIYYASYENRRVELVKGMSKAEGIRFLSKYRDMIMVDAFSDLIDSGRYIVMIIIDGKKVNIHRFEKEENCTLVTKSLQYVDPEKREEIIPLFYKQWDAQIFLEEYKANTSHIYLDMAATVAEEQAGEAIHKEVQVSKRNMTAVAKVCAAMVGTGLAYGVARTIIEKILESKKKTELILRNVQIGKTIFNATRVSGGIVKSFGALKCVGVLSQFSTPLALGTSISVCALNPVTIPIVVGVGAFVVITGLLVAFKDTVEEFLDDHPLLGIVYDGIKAVGNAIVNGVKTVATKIWDGIKWVGRKIWDGLCAVGSWIGGLFGF